MYWHIRTWHILPFILSQPSDSVKAGGIRLIHFPAILGDSWCLITKCSEVHGDPKQRKSREQVSWCPDWNSYARTRHKPLHYLGQAQSPGKWKAGSSRQEEEALSATWVCDATWQQKEADRRGISSERRDEKLSRGDSAEVWSAKLHRGLGIPLLESKSWVRGRASSTSNDLRAGKTDLRKIKRAWVTYRQFLGQDYLKGEKAKKGDKSLKAEQAVWLGSLGIHTALKDSSEIL